EVVRELPDVLIEDIVDRERLVSDRGVGDPVLSDLDRREGLAKRLPEVPEAVVAREKAVCEAARPAVQLQCERVQVIVDRVTRVGERQAGLIGPPTRVVEAQHEGMWRQILLGLQIIPPKRHGVAGVDIPVQLGNEFVVVRVVGVSLIRAGVIVVNLNQAITDRIHDQSIHPGDPESRGAAAAGREIRARLVRPPGAGSSKPNGLLKYDPSNEMLLYSQFLPEKL